MSSEPRAFLALDLGTATASVALVGRIEGRWRLIGSRAAPASIPVDALVVRLVDRLVATDPDLMTSIGVPEPAATADLVSLTARSRRAPRLAVVAGGERTLRALLSAASRAGWRPTGLSAERADSLEITQLVLDHEVDTVLLGADDPPGADERARLHELGQLLAAAAWRRRELRVVLAGGAADQAEVIRPGSGKGGRPGERQPRSADVSARLSPPSNVAESIDIVDAPVDEVAPVDEIAPVDGIALADVLPTAGDAASEGESTFAAGDAAPERDSTLAEGPQPPDGVALQDLPSSEPATPVDSTVEDATARAVTVATASEESVGPDASFRAPLAGDRTAPAGMSGLAAVSVDGDDGRLVLAPSAVDDGGEALRAFLERLHAAADDARLATARSVGTLADVLQIGIELIEIGHEAGQRVLARPVGEGSDSQRVQVTSATVADAALVSADAIDDHVDEVLAWATTALDRYRLRDRLRELRLAPWSDAAGEGAVVRAAAARAAIGRLLRATAPAPRALHVPAFVPDLLLAAGGALATVPGPAVALAMADLVRRPGVCQSAVDSGRLLGPLGMIEDEHDRIRILRDLADDLLVPLGSVVTPQGVRPGRGGGRLTLRDGSRSIDVDLIAGGLQLVDLPPGRRATLDLAFRDPVVLGAKGRRFEVEVSGGLSGLIVDLRDVPLRLPERAERRRELLGAWQRALWPGLE